MPEDTINSIHRNKYENNLEHDLGHLRMQNVVLVNKLKKQEDLLDDFMDLVDMFSTGNIDLHFYKRIRSTYLRNKEIK